MGVGTDSDDIWSLLLAEQIREHGRLFFRLAFGVLRNSAAAEDACQQALLKALQQRQTIVDPLAIRAWLARIVVNESLQLARRTRIEQRVMANHARRPAPDERAPDAGALREAVLEAMLRLPESQRLVVALRIMQDMRGNDVKDLLGCSAAEVSRQLHHAMEQLRIHLADWEHD